MKLFISHSSEERQLAEAWHCLLRSIEDRCFDNIEGDIVESWFSTDPDPGGGMHPGKWRDQVTAQLTEADVVLALFTPESMARPWIFFETAYAMGMGSGKHVIPVVYYTGKEFLPGPLRDQQCYLGDDAEEVLSLLKRLYRLENARVKGPLAEEPIRAYCSTVRSYERERTKHALFHSRVHNYGVAKSMEGQTWWAKWTKRENDGTHSIWQVHPLVIETTESRIRMVGPVAQGVLCPFEGIISSKDWIPLTYWLQGSSICGTTLLYRIDATRMVGTWEGMTAMSLGERLYRVRGRVVMSPEKNVVDGYWDLEPPGCPQCGEPLRSPNDEECSGEECGVEIDQGGLAWPKNDQPEQDED